MENKIYEERSIDDIISAKEKAIINLYAEQNHLDEEVAASAYFSSKLRNIIMDKESGLYLESPYYILERYAEYIMPVNLNIDISSMGQYLIPKSPFYAVNDLLVQPVCFKLVAAQNNTHYFGRVEQYQFLKDNLKNIVIAGTGGIGKSTLASIFAEKFGELGIIPKGDCVNIDEHGLVRKWLEKDKPFSKVGLLMIVVEYSNTMEHFWGNNPKIKNNFTNIACYKSPVSEERLTVYKSHYKENENSSLFEASMKIKSFIEML